MQSNADIPSTTNAKEIGGTEESSTERDATVLIQNLNSRFRLLVIHVHGIPTIERVPGVHWEENLSSINLGQIQTTRAIACPFGTIPAYQLPKTVASSRTIVISMQIVWKRDGRKKSRATPGKSTDASANPDLLAMAFSVLTTLLV